MTWIHHGQRAPRLLPPAALPSIEKRFWPWIDLFGFLRYSRYSVHAPARTHFQLQSPNIRKRSKRRAEERASVSVASAAAGDRTTKARRHKGIGPESEQKE